VHANRAARAAGLAAGAMSLPPGALGWLTLVPEMVGVWRIQAQLVADIARLHGRTATVTRAQMLYCLFRHSAAQAFRDLVVRAGERVLVRQASVRAIQAIARRIGVHLSQRAVAGAIARWVPLAGAIGVGVYAYRDTQQVARTAIALFQAERLGDSRSPLLPRRGEEAVVAEVIELLDAGFVEARVFDVDPAAPDAPLPRRRRRRRAS
jgi:hypothetical protein